MIRDTHLSHKAPRFTVPASKLAESVAQFLTVQQELVPVDEYALSQELRTTFLNESAHLPEVQLRYLILLILTDCPKDELQRAAMALRQELNALRQEKDRNI